MDINPLRINTPAAKGKPIIIARSRRLVPVSLKFNFVAHIMFCSGNPSASWGELGSAIR